MADKALAPEAAPDDALVFETPVAVRIARIVGGALLSIVAVGMLVFLYTTSQDRAMERLEADFLASVEAENNTVAREVVLQEKYNVSDEDLLAVLGDISRFDTTITSDVAVDQLTDIEISDKRVVFISGDVRFFYESSSELAMDYIVEYVDGTLRSQIAN